MMRITDPDQKLRLKLAAQLMQTLVEPGCFPEYVKSKLPDALAVADALIELQLAENAAKDKAAKADMVAALRGDA